MVVLYVGWSKTCLHQYKKVDAFFFKEVSMLTHNLVKFLHLGPTVYLSLTLLDLWIKTTASTCTVKPFISVFITTSFIGSRLLYFLSADPHLPSLTHKCCWARGRHGGREKPEPPWRCSGPRRQSWRRWPSVTSCRSLSLWRNTEINQRTASSRCRKVTVTTWDAATNRPCQWPHPQLPARWWPTLRCPSSASRCGSRRQLRPPPPDTCPPPLFPWHAH